MHTYYALCEEGSVEIEATHFQWRRGTRPIASTQSQCTRRMQRHDGSAVSGGGAGAALTSMGPASRAIQTPPWRWRTEGAHILKLSPVDIFFALLPRLVLEA